jgi:hypothetical protein
MTVVSGRHPCHGQPAPGRGDRVARAGVCLLADQQGFALAEPGVAVDDRRSRVFAVLGHGNTSWMAVDPAGTGRLDGAASATMSIRTLLFSTTA